MEIPSPLNKCLSCLFISPCKVLEIPNLGVSYCDADSLHMKIHLSYPPVTPWDLGSKRINVTMKLTLLVVLQEMKLLP